jgi:hypothetical protein
VVEWAGMVQNRAKTSDFGQNTQKSQQKLWKIQLFALTLSAFRPHGVER